jgi:hypothetical protein
MKATFEDDDARIVVPREAWMREHALHGEAKLQPHNHPDHSWFWLVCPCGAKLLDRVPDAPFTGPDPTLAGRMWGGARHGGVR